MLFWLLLLALVFTPITKAWILNVFVVLSIIVMLPVCTLIDYFEIVQSPLGRIFALYPPKVLIYQLTIWIWFIGEMAFGYNSTKKKLGDMGCSRSVFQRLHYRSMIRQKWSSLGSLLCYFLALLVNAMGYEPKGSRQINYIFVGMTGMGLLLRWWALYTLNEDFQLEIVEDTAEKRSLIQTGPYQAIRHPGYTGMIVYAAGLTSLLDNILLVLLVQAVLSIMLVRRVYSEELLLKSEFGTNFVKYKENVSAAFGLPWMDTSFDVYCTSREDAKPIPTLTEEDLKKFNLTKLGVTEVAK